MKTSAMYLRSDVQISKWHKPFGRLARRPNVRPTYIIFTRNLARRPHRARKSALCSQLLFYPCAKQKHLINVFALLHAALCTDTALVLLPACFLLAACCLLLAACCLLRPEQAVVRAEPGATEISFAAKPAPRLPTKRRCPIGGPIAEIPPQSQPNRRPGLPRAFQSPECTRGLLGLSWCLLGAI